MKCFYHPDREAAATCKDCGKGLCQECAAVYSPCSCPECVERKAKEKQIRYEKAKTDALIDTNQEFIGACIKGVIASVAIIVVTIIINDPKDPFTFGERAFLAFLFFFFPYGWAFATWFRARYMPSMIIPVYVWFIFAVIKFAISLVIGIPCFLFQLVRFLGRRHQISKM